MATSVQVLCPNGRRQTVKVTANTKLLQVLEEVCQRQGFIPAEDFKLVQGKKDLDLSLSFRFSSLPNNAKLELAKSTTARVEQDVTIALQLDSGQRLQDDFSPSISLWDLLLHFEGKNEELRGQLARVETGQGRQVHPVCIFMREEVVGEPALRATTLKKLALTSGKAIIRLLHRPVEESMIADICDQVEKDKAKQTKLEEMAQKKKEIMDQHEREDCLKESMKNKLSQIGEDRENETNGSGEQSQPHQPHPQNRSSRDEAMDVDGQQDEDTVSSASFSGDSSRHRTARTVSSTPATTQPPLQQNPIEQLRDMNLPGVQIFTPDDFNDLSPMEQAIAQRLAQRFMPHLQQATNPREQALSNQRQQIGHNSHQDEQSANVFVDFKFPENTRGMDLSAAGNSSSTQHDTSPCERNSLVYNASEALLISNEDVPESFFDVTQADVRLMYKDLQNAIHKLDDQPLMTRTLRQAQAEAAYDHYERVVIRVHFPDKLVIQAYFRPRETVGALHKFVKESLQDKSLKFYLYTTPPKVVLKDMKSSLALHQLAPAALVYFGCTEDREHYIKEDLIHSLKSRIEAETKVAEVLNCGITDTHNSTDSPATSQQRAGPSGASGRPNVSYGASSSSSSSTPATLPSGAKVPKWLKLGKK